MASGYRSNRSRARRNNRICSSPGVDSRHMRGLEEKIWNVLAPSSEAFRAAFSSEPAMDVWIPMRNYYGNKIGGSYEPRTNTDKTGSYLGLEFLPGYRSHTVWANPNGIGRRQCLDLDVGG